ncbi:MAG: haloacid dehalogenase type II [Hydrogenophaga sp.]|uniref:haloacid dehalogenase type II n=1 Tax=Hydrogenophaga sp. TaxID=1904254 RepID=UPI001D5C7BAF|nr:haloacid dehalogenase type II [Hydrogenophaga sp.]MBX3611621.1 haloacid dehalogenase type II [Hydrogenophaga sp.]
MDKPLAVLFDAYGTLFDVYSVGLRAEQLYPGRGARLAVLWRDRQIDYTRLITMSGDPARYRPFWDITESALRYAIQVIVPQAIDDFAPHEDAVASLMNEYRHLSAFPENREVLQALRARGVVTGILSNGDPDMLGIALRSAGLDGLLDHVISADAVRQYKVAPAVYELGERATGLSRGQILFVSSNAWDAAGAAWFGYRTLWINRNAMPFEQLGNRPEAIGSSLRAVLDLF